jgi:hypothetical protein
MQSIANMDVNEHPDPRWFCHDSLHNYDEENNPCVSIVILYFGQQKYKRGKRYSTSTESSQSCQCMYITELVNTVASRGDRGKRHDGDGLQLNGKEWSGAQPWNHQASKAVRAILCLVPYDTTDITSKEREVGDLPKVLKAHFQRRSGEIKG